MLVASAPEIIGRDYDLIELKEKQDVEGSSWSLEAEEFLFLLMNSVFLFVR